MVVKKHESNDMKLLQRIRALDASRRLDVVSKYIPAMLVHGDCDSTPNENNMVIGHIHSDLVEIIRSKIDEGGYGIQTNNRFCFPLQ